MSESLERAVKSVVVQLFQPAPWLSWSTSPGLLVGGGKTQKMAELCKLGVGRKQIVSLAFAAGSEGALVRSRDPAVPRDHTVEAASRVE